MKNRKCENLYQFRRDQIYGIAMVVMSQRVKRLPTPRAFEMTDLH
jgi:hypothetical protein